MSGFVAALRLSDSGADCAELLARPVAKLPLAGTGIGRWVEDPAGLIQIQSQFQSDAGGPWQARANGPVLCGDLGLINGRDLAARTGTAYRGDALAVLAAYDRWGADMPSRLEGEFAFVLWDPAARRLLAGRDRFGIKSLAYRATPRMVLVASDAVALEAAGAAPSAEWIAAFLDASDRADNLTPFRDVLDVLPGHLLQVEGGLLREDAWWRLEPLVLPPDDAPAALAEALDAAVRDRMGTPCATLLSGGLDSSVISCLAARAADHPIHAVSIRHSAAPEMDEGRFIDAVRSGRNIRGIDIEASSGNAFAALDDVLISHGHPVYAPNQAMPRQFYAAAAQSGASVVLDGHGGDEVIGTGDWLFSELAYNRRWRSFLREARAHRAVTADRGGLNRGLIAALALSGPSLVRPVAGMFHRDATQSGLPSLVAPGAPRPDASGQGAVFRHDHLTDLSMRFHARLLLNRRTVDAFEFLGRLARRVGIEARFPFYDRRVVAITLGQPTSAKITPNQPRALIRRAMVGILPEDVRTRPDKTDFSANVLTSFTPERLQMLRDLAERMPERLRPHVDPQALRRGVAVLEQGKMGLGAHAPLVRLIWLDRWLALRDTDDPTAQVIGE